LIDRIDKLDSSNTNKSDGVTYWKGKKIISLEQWFKISRPNNSSNADTNRVKQGLEYFPNDYREMIFLLGVPDILVKDVNAWHKDYMNLMDYMQNQNLGKRKCRDCLLNPNNEGSYFGLYKFIANAIVTTKPTGIDANDKTTSYPCNIINFYSCPYNTEGKNEETITRKDLFSLNKVAEIVGRALSKALDIKGTRIIYKINFESNKVQEIDTFLYKDPNIKRVVEIKSTYKPVDHKFNEIMERIEKLSVITMKDLDDIFTILTDRQKLDAILEIGLDRRCLAHKEKLVEFFISIKSTLENKI